MPVTSRRAFLGYTAAAAGLSVFHIGKSKAAVPEFKYKWATNAAPSHPLNIRGQQALDRIKAATDGRLVITLFPNNQLGADNDLFAQVRSGAVEFYSISPIFASTFVPSAAISGVGFAFKDRKTVYAALDGDLGAHVRADFAKTGIIALDKIFDLGFRQISSSVRPVVAPADLKGMKFRVPPGPLYASLFQTLGASPTIISFNEVYTALQTKIVDGQDNPIAFVHSQRFYEVQKYFSLTNHIWDGQWVFANKRAFQTLPADMQAIVQREFGKAADDQRADIANSEQALLEEFKKAGLAINATEPDEFRKTLRIGGYYKQWREKFGNDAWTLLERYAGEIS